MNLKIHTARPTKGNVLIVCLCMAAIIGFAVASCFAYVRSQMVVAVRSQAWNESLILAEAGIEDGLMLINKNSGTTTPRTAWAGTANSDNWTAIAANVYHVQRSLNSNTYEVYITNNANGRPTIRAVGTKWQQGIGGTNAIRRAILVTTVPGSMFQGGLIAKDGISIGGNIVIDSFNSQNPNLSTNGMYHPSLRNDGGNVATTISNVVAAVTVGGSVEIYGKIFTGPGEKIKVNGGGVSVGSESWVDGGGSGIESGWSQDDLNVFIPDAPPAPTGGLPLPSKQINLMQGTNYSNSYLLTTGNYQANSSVSLTSTDKILVSGHVKMYFANSFSMAGQSQVIIGADSSLTIYAGGSVSLNGGGVMNGSGFATNLTLYGLPTSTSISYAGGSDFVGTIYAPQAAFTMTGGGNTIYNLVGSAVAKTIKLNGKYQVHYDESLSQIAAGAHYYVASWQEVPF